MNLKKLLIDIKKDGKIDSDELVMMLADFLENEDSIETSYQDIYEKAYGHTMNKSLAECWVHNLSVTDKSDRKDGEMWTCEQTAEIGSKIGIDWNKFSKIDWYVVMNAAYSDFYNFAKKYEHEDDPVFYACLAKAFWVDDLDVKNKTPLSYYFNYVA